MNSRKAGPASRPKIASSRQETSSSPGLASSTKAPPASSETSRDDSNINTVTSLASRAILRLRMLRAAKNANASSKVRH